jgi:DNA-directed RNA polymerase subunit M/transcription elongation factor TFIIS
MDLRLIKLDILIDSINSIESSGSLSNDEVNKLASALEETCYKYAIKKIYPSDEGLANFDCDMIYHLKIARMIDLFSDEKGFVRLYKKIKDNHLKIDDLPDIDILEIFPERYVKQIARIEETGKEIPVKYSTLYTCNNCKQSKGIIQTAQTRSIDEGNTIFVNCAMCPNVFTV